MKIATLLLVVLFLCFSPGPSVAGLGAQCHGDSVQINFSVTGVEDSSHMESIVVVAQRLGSCEPEEIISQETYPYPSVGETVAHQFSIQGLDPSRYFRLEVKTMDSGGVLHEIGFQPMISGPTFHLISCGDAIALRGLFLTDDTGALLECSGYCWPAHVLWNFDLWEGEGDPQPEFGLYNFYGEYYYSTMLPWGLVLQISHMEMVTDPAGCDAVKIETKSWDGLKALYR